MKYIGSFSDSGGSYSASERATLSCSTLELRSARSRVTTPKVPGGMTPE
jgi:hypothetical protein